MRTYLTILAAGNRRFLLLEIAVCVTQTLDDVLMDETLRIAVSQLHNIALLGIPCDHIDFMLEHINLDVQ